MWFAAPLVCLRKKGIKRRFEILLFSVDCNVGPWGSWSSCSVTCGGGSKTRTRCNQANQEEGLKLSHYVVATLIFRGKVADATNNGTKCASARMIPITETNTCNDVSCPSGKKSN